MNEHTASAEPTAAERALIPTHVDAWRTAVALTDCQVRADGERASLLIATFDGAPADLVMASTAVAAITAEVLGSVLGIPPVDALAEITRSLALR